MVCSLLDLINDIVSRDRQRLLWSLTVNIDSQRLQKKEKQDSFDRCGENKRDLSVCLLYNHFRLDTIHSTGLDMLSMESLEAAFPAMHTSFSSLVFRAMLGCCLHPSTGLRKR